MPPPFEYKGKLNGLDLSLFFCSQELSLESAQAFSPSGLQGSKAPQFPRKRGARVYASHLFEHGKIPRPSRCTLQLNFQPSAFFISSCFIFPTFCGHFDGQGNP